MLALSIADRSHLRRHTVEANCKNEPCYVDRAAASHAWITVVLWGLSFNCVAILSLDFDTPFYELDVSVIF
jgi:hypothetical protein